MPQPGRAAQAHGSGGLVKAGADASRRRRGMLRTSLMTLIIDPAEAAAFFDRQREAAFVAIDTEFMRESTYWPKLCLVQLAGPAEAAAIDPLAPGMDLHPLL